MKVFGYILLFANIAVLFSSSWLAVGIIGLIDFIWLAMAAKPAPKMNKVEDDDWVTSPIFSDYVGNMWNSLDDDRK